MNKLKRFPFLPLLFLALVLIRVCILFKYFAHSPVVPPSVIFAGLLEDLSVTVLVGALSLVIAGFAPRAARLAQLLLGVSLWLVCLVNLVYYMFFDTHLDLWVVRAQGGDAGEVLNSFVDLLLNGWVIASILSLFVGIWLTVKKGQLFERMTVDMGRFGRGLAGQAVNFSTGVLLLGICLLLKQSPVWFHAFTFDPAERVMRGMIGSEQIVWVWWDQAVGAPEDVRKNFGNYRKTERPFETMIAYQNSVSQYRSGKKSDRTQVLKEFGLPASGPINVVFLFLESTRGYEYGSPKLAPIVVPRLTNLIRKHGVYFEQTYSSSLEPGQTARGVFSTLCSRIPNVRGSAEYISHTNLKVDCLPQLLLDAGFETISIQPYRNNFHNAFVFESLHGIRTFRDVNDIIKDNPKAAAPSWGAYEHEALNYGLKFLRETAKAGKPMFAHFRTNATHHPFYHAQGDGIDQKFASTLASTTYIRYLNALHSTDESMANFIESLFQSEIGDNTLLVLLGDHSLILDMGAEKEISPAQLRELQIRIPLAFMTKNMKRPRRISTLAHQLDVTPTVAMILGISPSQDWLGSDLLSGPGHPWVYQSTGGVSFRLPNRACYGSLYEWGQPACFDVPAGRDPLFDGDLKQVAAVESEIKFFEDVIAANRELTQTNRIRGVKSE